MKRNKKITNKNNNGRFGILSLMAMTIGVVIGSGIFVKNSSLLTVNGSVLYTLISWLLVSLIVIMIVIAFLEIITIIEISDEQSTITNWGRHLIGIRFGNYLGYYMTLVYFPIMMAALLIIGGDQIVITMELLGINLSPWSM